jgi:hypothetical protein
MKIRAADSTGIPVPQFVVTAETQEEEMLLKAFLMYPTTSKDKVKFWLHGWGGDQNVQYKNFNFGWVKENA